MYGLIGAGLSGKGRIIHALGMMAMAIEMNSQQSDTFIIKNYRKASMPMPIMFPQVRYSSAGHSRTRKRTPMTAKQLKARKATKRQRQARKVNR